jgi:hypothetical protein
MMQDTQQRTSTRNVVTHLAHTTAADRVTLVHGVDGTPGAAAYSWRMATVNAQGQGPGLHVWPMGHLDADLETQMAVCDGADVLAIIDAAAGPEGSAVIAHQSTLGGTVTALHTMAIAAADVMQGGYGLSGISY